VVSTGRRGVAIFVLLGDTNLPSRRFRGPLWRVPASPDGRFVLDAEAARRAAQSASRAGDPFPPRLPTILKGQGINNARGALSVLVPWIDASLATLDCGTQSWGTVCAPAMLFAS
jgi:hypothetical protein